MSHILICPNIYRDEYVLWFVNPDINKLGYPYSVGDEAYFESLGIPTGTATKLGASSWAHMFGYRNTVLEADNIVGLHDKSVETVSITRSQLIDYTLITTSSDRNVFRVAERLSTPARITNDTHSY